MMFSPTLGSIQGTKHRLSKFTAHAWQHYLGILVWQSDVDVPDSISVEVCSTHICNGEQEGVLNSTRNTSSLHATLSRTRRVSSGGCREDRFDPFMAHLSTHQTRTATWGFGAPFFGIDPLEANWVASRSHGRTLEPSKIIDTSEQHTVVIELHRHQTQRPQTPNSCQKQLSSTPLGATRTRRHHQHASRNSLESR